MIEKLMKGKHARRKWNGEKNTGGREDEEKDGEMKTDGEYGGRQKGVKKKNS